MSLLKTLSYYIISAIEIILYVKNWPIMISLLLQKSSTREHLVKLRRPPLKLIVRSAMDLWSIKETFLDAFYTRYGVPIQDGWIVVDIGAAIGDFSIYAAYGNPHAVIYAYEPLPGSYQLLLKNLRLNGIENVLPFQEAVWSHSGDLLLDLSAREPLKVTSGKISAVYVKTECVTVPSLSLKDLLIREKIDKINLLKLDCEGAEYEILMKTPSDVLKRIERIVMEYHDLSEAQHHKVLVSFLEDEGYRVLWKVNVVHANIGYLYAERK